MMLNLGGMTINLDLVSRVHWDFAGHKDTAMITFTGGDFYWVQDAIWAGELRAALMELGSWKLAEKEAE